MAIGAQRILEIGTAIGYSGIWLAGALAQRRDAAHDGEGSGPRADGARELRARGRRRSRRRDRRRRAGDDCESRRPVRSDFSGRKQSRCTCRCSTQLVGLLRPGGLLVTDNVLWDGEVVPGFVDPPKRDAEDTRAIAEYNQRLNAHPQLITTTIPLRDGVAISVKRTVARSG